ncbi:hypothetical protein B0T16DRAFT_457821 [Cercophora newfieldiana]|uniref:Uncharacterized protein n=1 Tax=Cercophora newfieldiana TaxID=92897 RepID=A0AA39Y4K3_9PEZI|nr:hypothetical protein B0T16DRAFT_457821 [Cercophora newfieldiana]
MPSNDMRPHIAREADNGAAVATWEIPELPLSVMRTLTTLAFFHPDSEVLESLVMDAESALFPSENMEMFEFFKSVDHLDGLSLAKISYHRYSMSLSTYQAVQDSLLYKLPGASLSHGFNTTVKILSSSFPNIWQDMISYNCRGYSSWESCSVVLPHINYLTEIKERHNITSVDAATWAELLFRAATHLWEAEQLHSAMRLVLLGTETSLDLPVMLAAQGHRLLGHILLDLARPRDAVLSYTNALHLVLELHPTDPPCGVIAQILDSIALCLLEVGDVAGAFQALQWAMPIHRTHNSDRMAHPHFVRAMVYLRSGNPSRALEELSDSWASRGTTQEEIEAGSDPERSSDVLLLAKIYWAQGKSEEAEALARKSICMRKAIALSTRGEVRGRMRVAESNFMLGLMHIEEGKMSSAEGFLQRVVKESRGYSDMGGHMARSLWLLANVASCNGSTEKEVETLRKRARVERSRTRGREWEDEDTDEGFMRLASQVLL